MKVSCTVLNGEVAETGRKVPRRDLTQLAQGDARDFLGTTGKTRARPGGIPSPVIPTNRATQSRVGLGEKNAGLITELLQSKLHNRFSRRNACGEISNKYCNFNKLVNTPAGFVSVHLHAYERHCKSSVMTVR